MLRHEGVLFMRNIKEDSLYLVISEEYGLGRSAFEIADGAIAGGVDIIQLREKNKPRNELKDLAVKIAALCRDISIPFIVNDDPALAVDAGADGVHLGQEDMQSWPMESTRKMLGPDKIIGVSTHCPGEFKSANDSDADYITFGPIFTTRTKNYFIGTKDVRDIIMMAKKPVFFIGGINLSNVDGLLKQGVRNIALIRAITESRDIESTTRRFKESICGRTEKNVNKN
jgi:thiamine-phosphate pyrophosphorylase